MNCVTKKLFLCNNNLYFYNITKIINFIREIYLKYITGKFSDKMQQCCPILYCSMLTDINKDKKKLY